MIGARFNGYSMQSAHRMTAPDYIEDLTLKCQKKTFFYFC